MLSQKPTSLYPQPAPLSQKQIDVSLDHDSVAQGDGGNPGPKRASRSTAEQDGGRHAMGNDPVNGSPVSTSASDANAKKY